MRRFEKKAILEILDTIGEAHKAYQKYRKNGDKESCESVLSSCQQCVIAIGDAIEKSEGEGTKSVKALEEYCEDLYQLSQGETGISLDNDLINIRKCIADEIKVVLEVVFFPYKASMWDSLESIYLSFKKRDDVNVYLVPIPYYNRNNDGTVDAMHYEGDMFPAGESVTGWKAFDVAKIRPDIAFIHNPYDDMNFVTTVDPRFYSSELKKNVDCLVYCPYFSTAGKLPEALGLCKSYLYADYILTQSDYQIDFYDKVIPRSKFMTMGSPKFDRVIRLNNERNEDPDKFYSEVPFEWRSRRKGRKVFFYNTSLTGLLSSTDLFFDKMEYVFETFSKHKNVLLLWRPHPLMEETIKAMRPEYYDRFLEIKEKFKKEDLGILDDTPDISYSVAYCDAFIGDEGTSVTSLFVVTGKPLYILDNMITRPTTEKDLSDGMFQVPFEEYGCGYITTYDNQVYKCDYPIEDAIHYKYVFSLSDYKMQMYYGSYEVNGNIYFAPLCTENIAVYNQNGRLGHIELKHYTDESYKFFASVQYKNYLILIPDRYPYFVRADLDTGELTYTEDLRDSYISTDSNMNRFYGGCITLHNILFVGSRQNNKILMINMDTIEHEMICVGNDTGSGCIGFVYVRGNNVSMADEDSVLILPYKGMVVRRFYPDTGEVRNYEVNIDGFYCSDTDLSVNHDDIMPFSSAVIIGDNVYLAPSRGNKFVVLNIVTGESHELKSQVSLELDKYSCYYTGGRKGRLIHNKDKYYWASDVEKCLYEVELTDDKCNIKRNIPVNFNIDELKANSKGFGIAKPWWNQYCLYEDANNTLDTFLSGKVYGALFDKQKELDSFKKVAVNLDGTCGQHVCDFLIKKMEL